MVLMVRDKIKSCVEIFYAALLLSSTVRPIWVSRFAVYVAENRVRKIYTAAVYK